MIKSNQLILESLDWKGGDFVPGYGYYYGLINGNLIFFSSCDHPFDFIDNIYEVPTSIKNIEYGKYCTIDNISYRMPTIIELIDIFNYYNKSHLSYSPVPLKLAFADCPNYYFSTIIKKAHPCDNYGITYVLLINSINVKSIKYKI